MAEYKWPAQGTAALIGKHVDRIDGLEKASGTAKYAYDINPPKMLLARALSCPHAHCKIKSIDVTPAISVPGVANVQLLKQVGNEIRWQGDLIAVVAAETEGAAAEGLQAIKVEYEQLDVFVNEEDLKAAEAAGRTGSGGQNVQLENEVGEAETDAAFEKLFKSCDAVVEGHYGIHMITHMCLEPHGSTCEWDGGKLTAHLSTQNVSGTGGQFAQPLGITANDVTVHCDFMGGGFGSKFAADSWGVACARISKETGRPVKFMLTREQELQNAGNRPSGFINVKIGADSRGVVKVWDSHHWGTSGDGGGGVSQAVIPYVFNPPNRRRKQTTIKTNIAPARAWRAPNHPQGCAITQVAYDDIAAKLGMDSYDVFLRNLGTTGAKRAVYEEEMKIAARLMDWKAKWHPHGKGGANGSKVSGLGMAIHTWGGGGHNSSARVVVHPDGGVETFLGSQDIGTGTRTCIGMVVAETFGLPLEAVKVNIGNSKYPASGPSGGSTTIGGVSESNRRASQDALEQIVEKVAGKLGVQAADLEAKGGKIQTRDGQKSLSWKEACGLLGMNPLETTASFTRGAASPLSSSNVGGVQMAEVEVDKETGVVKMKKFVAVQDMGLIINRQTAESQIYGAVIMGIAYALFEEIIADPKTGAFLNADLDKYKLPRLGDIGEIVVELYEPASEYNRGVVGLGEPPVISPGGAISNAICNALGVRVPVLPATPDRVLKALKKA
jgi:xanthine dehydrogenase YagR molybdenum-binding subunit